MINLTFHERIALGKALYLQQLHVARQRGLTEQNLARGVSDVDVCQRLAYHEELELASLDSLATKLLAR